jgi:peroxiredoxin
MATELTVGNQAPNFDLTSTEGVVLMLHDEVPRMQVLLYLFQDLEMATTDLSALSQNAARLAGKGIKIIAVSPVSLDELKVTQQQLELPFPLLHDDRDFSLAYGVGGGTPAALVLVDRNRQISWLERGKPGLGSLVASLPEGRSGNRESTSNYPRSVINRFVDHWVN